MSRISRHESPKPGELCQHCKVAVGKWGELSCIWRNGSDADKIRPIPKSFINDFTFILGRIQEIKLSENNELVESQLEISLVGMENPQ